MSIMALVPVENKKTQQTMEAEAIKELEAILNCVICTEPYKNPKVLPCQHTFCHDCLSQMYDCFRQERYTILGQITCPVCSVKVVLPRGGINGLPDDFKIGQIREFLEKTHIATIRNQDACDICRFSDKTVRGAFYCVQCAKHLCSSCKDYHEKNPLFETHSVILIEDNNVLALSCRDHKEEIKYVCVECTSLSCLVCVLAKHPDHRVTDLTAASQQQHETIGGLLTSLNIKLDQFRKKAEILNTLRNQHEKVFFTTQEHIKQHTKDVIEKATQNEAQMLEELESRHDTALQRIEQEAQGTEINISNLDSLIDFAASMSVPSQSFQLMAMYNHLQSRMENMTHVHFEPIEESLQEVDQFDKCLDVNLGKFYSTSIEEANIAVGHMHLNEDSEDDTLSLSPSLSPTPESESKEVPKTKPAFSMAAKRLSSNHLSRSETSVTACNNGNVTTATIKSKKEQAKTSSSTTARLDLANGHATVTTSRCDQATREARTVIATADMKRRSASAHGDTRGKAALLDHVNPEELLEVASALQTPRETKVAPWRRRCLARTAEHANAQY